MSKFIKVSGVCRDGHKEGAIVFLKGNFLDAKRVKTKKKNGFDIDITRLNIRNSYETYYCTETPEEILEMLECNKPTKPTSEIDTLKAERLAAQEILMVIKDTDRCICTGVKCDDCPASGGPCIGLRDRDEVKEFMENYLDENPLPGECDE